jgi:hypothetical protein
MENGGEMENTGSVSPQIRNELSRALASEDEHYARLAADITTRLDVQTCSFLRLYSIYCVEHFAPSKPILFYVGFAPGRRAYLLTARPDNFVSMCRGDGVVINSSAVATEYAVTYLNATRSMSELFYLVNSVDDVRFRPDLAAEQEEIKAAFASKHRTLIAPPTAESQGERFVVIAFAVRQQTVERHTLAVSEKGDVEADVTVIEQNLPMVYGL